MKKIIFILFAVSVISMGMDAKAASFEETPKIFEATEFKLLTVTTTTTEPLNPGDAPVEDGTEDAWFAKFWDWIKAKIALIEDQINKLWAEISAIWDKLQEHDTKLSSNDSRLDDFEKRLETLEEKVAALEQYLMENFAFDGHTIPMSQEGDPLVLKVDTIYVFDTLEAADSELTNTIARIDEWCATNNIEWTKIEYSVELSFENEAGGYIRKVVATKDVDGTTTYNFEFD